MTDTAAPVGRPSKYDPAYCEAVVARQAEGWSLAEFAAHVGVSRQTIDNWGAAHPEFLEALSRAKAAEQAWWEKAGREGLHADKFNAAVWKKSVEARFRDDYTERTESKTTLDGAVKLERIERVIVPPPANPDSGSIPTSSGAGPL